MMGSSNLGHRHHHHHHNQKQQQQQPPCGSPSLADSSFHVVGSNHDWSSDLMLNDDGFSSNFNGVTSRPRDFNFRQGHEIVVPHLQTSMVQDLGLHWPSNAENYSSHSTLGEIKEELSYPSTKFSSSTVRDASIFEDCHLPSTGYFKHEQGGFHDLSEKKFLRTLSSINQFNGLQLSSPSEFSFSTQIAADNLVTTTGSRGDHNTVLATVNVPSSNSSSSSSFQSFLGMDFQALDLLASAKIGGSFSYPSLSDLALLREDFSFGLGHRQEPTQIPSQRHHKTSSLCNGATEAKRALSVSEHKAPQPMHKKPRFESPRSSFSPFKVRKEKLGDRIAALQQLVAPFGKTDTASVLMEAIGYIKFLQDQVETLSVPYLRSSSNSKCRTANGASSGGRDEPKLGLRSRGLCLVPLSCTSYVTNDTATTTDGGVWPSPPNFRGSI